MKTDIIWLLFHKQTMDKKVKDNLPVLGTNISWKAIDKEILRVVDYRPYAKIEGSKIKSIPNFPYAMLDVESPKLEDKATLYVTHKLDFMNVNSAFDKKKDDEEILVVWSNNNYKSSLHKLISATMPKLVVWLCKKGAYELMTDKDYKPELSGEARYLAEKPLTEWKPEVME